MGYFDYRPRFSPIINSVPYRYSVGVYCGRKRVVLAWFLEKTSANDYLIRCRRDCPRAKFDCLQSLF